MQNLNFKSLSSIKYVSTSHPVYSPFPIKTKGLSSPYFDSSTATLSMSMKKVDIRHFHLVQLKPLWGFLILSIRLNKIIYLSYCMATEVADNQFTLLQKCKLCLLNLSRQSYILVSLKGKGPVSQANYLPSYSCLFFTTFNDDFKDGHSII